MYGSNYGVMDTHVAKLVEISKQLVRFSKHKMTFDLHLLHGLHKTLNNQRTHTLAHNTIYVQRMHNN